MVDRRTLPTRSAPSDPGRTTVRACAGAFNTYATLLHADVAWYREKRFSLLTVDELLERVERVADALAEEANVLEQRSLLREAVPPVAFPLLDETINAVIAGAHTYTTGPAASVLEERGDGARGGTV